MGFKVQGFGTSKKELSTALDGIEKDLKLLSELSLGKTELPEGKAAIRERAGVLDAQIKVLEKHLGAADPATQKHATALLEVAKRERLRLEDGLLAWAMDDIAARMPSHAPAPVEMGTEIAAVSAMLGGLLSQAEIAHVVNVMGPLAGKNVALEAFGPTIDASNVDHERRSKKTSKEKMTVVAKRISPVMGGFLATSALRSFGAAPALAFLTAALAIRSGIQTGKYLADGEIKKVAVQTGMNRLEGETDHDIVRMWERANKSLPFKGKEGDVLLQAIKQEAALTRYLVERREETFPGRNVSDSEKLAIKHLKSYASELDASLTASSPPKALSEAQYHLALSTVNGKLEDIPSLIQLAPTPSRAETTEKAFAGLMHAYGKQMLAVSNPGLFRFLPVLEGLNRKPNEGELEYLRQRVGPEPSVGEVLALHSLHMAGKLDMNTLWPPSAQVGVPTGEDMAPTTLKNMLDGLGHRDAGARREWWGKMVGHAVPFVGAALGAGVLSLFTDPTIAAYVTAIGGAMLGEKVGRVIGERLSGAGRVERTNTGVEIGNAFGSEYATSISRFLKRDITSGSREELTDRFRKEAGALRTMIQVSKQSNEAFKQAYEANPEAASEEKLGREYSAIESLRTPVLAQLEGFASTLEALSKSNADLSTLRSEFTTARSALLPTIGAVALDVLSTGPDPEVRMGHGIYYMLKTKLAKDMLAGTNQEVAKKGAEEIYLAREALPRSERPKADALDDWAERVHKKPERVSDLRMVSKLLSPAYVAKLEAAGHDARHLPDDRMKDLAQETMNALISQVYSRFGLFEADRVPELSGLAVERLPTTEADELASYRVSGKLPGGGQVSIEFDAVGRPIADFEKLSLDLGERLLTDMARIASERHIAALDGSSTTLGKPSQAVRSDEAGTYSFTFKAGGRTVETVIGLDGSLGPDSIKA